MEHFKGGTLQGWKKVSHAKDADGHVSHVSCVDGKSQDQYATHTQYTHTHSKTTSLLSFSNTFVPRKPIFEIIHYEFTVLLKRIAWTNDDHSRKMEKNCARTILKLNRGKDIGVRFVHFSQRFWPQENRWRHMIATFNRSIDSVPPKAVYLTVSSLSILYCPVVFSHFLDPPGNHPRGAIFPTVD